MALSGRDNNDTKRHIDDQWNNLSTKAHSPIIGGDTQ
jgi:hypothetical protein